MVISKLAEVVSCMLGFRRFAEAWKFWCFRPPVGPPEAPEAPEALAVQLLQIHSSSSMLLRNSYLPYQKGGQVKCFETMQNLWNSLEGGWFCWYRYRKYECLIHTHRTCSDCLLIKSGTTSPAQSLSQNLWIGFEKYEIQNTCSPIVESKTASPTQLSSFPITWLQFAGFLNPTIQLSSAICPSLGFGGLVLKWTFDLLNLPFIVFRFLICFLVEYIAVLSVPVTIGYHRGRKLEPSSEDKNWIGLQARVNEFHPRI